MNPDRWQKIDELLDQALELSAEERAIFLSNACAGDEDLRREVESLLAAHERSGSFIETNPAAGVVAEFSKQYLQPPPSLVGRKLGSYELTALIGAGGMGEVYRARDPRLDRNVAIKVLPQHLSAHPEALARFEREAKAVAALSHPNILAIHDFGQQDGVTYAVMELLEGQTLRTRMEASVLPWREAVKIAASVAEGLAAAHARGIIHRDIKPENIFLTAEGLVKILDFGIARVKKAVISNADTLISQGVGDTKPGTLMGTIGYMSPEQVRGETAESPSDIFSLGCVLTESLTGARPFARPSAPETMAAILRDEPPSLEDLSQEIPFELERILLRCLEKKPEDRFQSARDLALDLRALLTSASGTYRAASGAHRSVSGTVKIEKTRASRMIPAVVAVAVIVAGIAALLWWKFKQPPAPPPNSLAVLPLLNAGEDKSIDYLSEGITESIITNLAPLRPKLRVLANSSVSAYKGKNVDPRQAGHELNVRAVLVGKVLQQGEILFIQVELVDATDGTRLWGDRYQRNRADLLAVQEEISRQISEKLQLNLTGEERKLIARRSTQNTEAYYLYLNGRYFWNQRESEQLKKAIEFFQRAIALDRNYALAYAGMADAYVLLSGSTEVRAQAENFARKALALDDTLAEPYATLGFLKTFRDWNWTEAESDFKRALALNPDCATAHHWYSILLTIQGRFETAMAEIIRAREIDPRSFPINKDYGSILYLSRRYDEALVQLRRTIESEPTNPLVAEAHSWMRNAYDQQRKFTAAIEEMKAISSTPEEIAELLESLRTGDGNAYWQKRLEIQIRNGRATLKSSDGRMRLIYGYTATGEIEKAIPLLEQAVTERNQDSLAYLKVDPRFDNLRAHPLFPELLRRMNLAN
ncbi:MAG TPA: protein kinase [Blastocatellia bacterium]|nr:protein kinase [Blastocatellia bacterium]